MDISVTYKESAGLSNGYYLFKVLSLNSIWFVLDDYIISLCAIETIFHKWSVFYYYNDRQILQE